MVNPSPVDAADDKLFDLFISHASEDKAGFVRPLVNRLSRHGLAVWFDETTLTLGDSLRGSIDKGLSRSRFGVVVLSPAFFSKKWPQLELDGLWSLEMLGGKRILPVWHEVTFADVARFSPTLANRVAVSSSTGTDKVVQAIRRAAQVG
jgi:hypothetical protein